MSPDEIASKLDSVLSALLAVEVEATDTRRKLDELEEAREEFVYQREEELDVLERATGENVELRAGAAQAAAAADAALEAAMRAAERAAGRASQEMHDLSDKLQDREARVDAMARQVINKDLELAETRQAIEELDRDRQRLEESKRAQAETMQNKIRSQGGMLEELEDSLKAFKTQISEVEGTRMNDKIKWSQTLIQEQERAEAAVQKIEEAKRAVTRKLEGKISKQQEQLGDLEGTVQDLKAKMSESETERMNENIRFSQTLVSEQERAQAAVQELEEAKRSQAKELESKIASQTDRLQKLAGSLDDMTTKMSDSETERMNEKIWMSQALYGEQERAQTALEAEQSSRHAEGIAYESKISSQADRLQKLAGSLDSLTSKMSESETQRMQDKITYSQTLNQEQERAEKVARELEEAKRVESIKSQSTITSQREQLESLKGTVANLKSQMSETETARMNEKIRLTQALYAEQERTEATLRDIEEAKRTESERLRGRISLQEQELEKLVVSLQGVETRLSDSETDRMSEKIRLSQALYEQQENSEATVTSLEDAKHREGENLRHKISSQAQHLSELQSSLKGLKEEMAEAEISRQNERIKNAQAGNREDERFESTWRAIEELARKELELRRNPPKE